MMRSKSTGPSQRQLKVGEEIRHILAEVFSRRDTGSQILNSSSITVTEVRLSPDLKNATVFVFPLGGTNIDQIMNELLVHGAAFRSHIARQMRLKVTPKLNFRSDQSFDEADRIERLLQTARVKRDL